MCASGHYCNITSADAVHTAEPSLWNTHVMRDLKEPTLTVKRDTVTVNGLKSWLWILQLLWVWMERKCTGAMDPFWSWDRVTSLSCLKVIVKSAPVSSISSNQHITRHKTLYGSFTGNAAICVIEYWNNWILNLMTLFDSLTVICKVYIWKSNFSLFNGLLIPYFFIYIYIHFLSQMAPFPENG